MWVILGIKKGRYGDWERETREINLRDAIRIADLFDCTLDELAGREWPPAGVAASPLADEAERALVDAYRSANPQGKAAIEAVAESQRVSPTADALPAPADGAVMVS